MPPLPETRVTPMAPFTATGLDYLGPLYIKKFGETRTTQKVWVCLFTCLSTRAVHLELIDDMTAEQFLLCLQRFIARRGKPTIIISDNAPQFKLVNLAIDKLWENVIVNEKIANYISSENIKWKFIIECAPWKGGFYKRLVRLVKQSLRKSIGKICLTFTQLQMLIIEIEAVINSRPLAYIGSDFASGTALTPAHFLTLNAKTGTPMIDLNEEKDTNYLEKLSSKDRLIENWKKGQCHLEHFWKLWRDNYLLNLRERSQRHIKQPRIRSSMTPKIGDVVLVQNDGPRGTWKLARVKKLHGSDGNWRSAEIITATGTVMNRSLLHLYPLEIDVNKMDDLNADNNEIDVDLIPNLQNPTEKTCHAEIDEHLENEADD